MKTTNAYMKNTSKTGQIGEDLAVEYLINKSYKVIGRNLRQKWGELDIAAIDPAKVLVFVEVKTIRQSGNRQSGILPEENLTKAKLNKLQRTAMMFAGQHSHLINEDRGWRIDLIAVTLFDEGSSINHYENI